MYPNELKELSRVFIESLEMGMPLHSIKSAMQITFNELAAMIESYPEIRLLIRTGQLNAHNELFDLTRLGSASPSLYSFACKTMYKDFYPQEQDTSNEDRIKEAANSILNVVARRTTNWTTQPRQHHQ